MTPGERAAALAERERIARLADECHAWIDWQSKRTPFATMIRVGLTRPPWAGVMPGDPLAEETTTTR